MSELLEYKCPACGGALEFDSSLQKLKCPYCDSIFEVEELSEKETTLNEADSDWNMANSEWEDGETAHMCVFVCNSCGGEIVGDENTGASECPFCGNQVVMRGAFSGALKPDYVIPFKFDKKAAKEKYAEHISKKPLLPNTFKKDNHIDEIKGIYVPFWIYDADVSASASFTAEKVRHWSDSKYNYTETSIYDIYREGTMSFEHIPCDGSTKMDDTLMESIEPFDFDEAVPFQSAYLAGYFADKYDVDQYENLPRADERIKNSAVSVLQDTFDAYYTSVQKKAAQSSRTSGDVKYALYPVWLLTSTYKGEKYTFAMNGQTGKFVGNLPIDKKKKLLYGLSSFAVSTVVSAIVAYFLGIGG